MRQVLRIVLFILLITILAILKALLMDTSADSTVHGEKSLHDDGWKVVQGIQHHLQPNPNDEVDDDDDETINEDIDHADDDGAETDKDSFIKPDKDPNLKINNDDIDYNDDEMDEEQKKQITSYREYYERVNETRPLLITATFGRLGNQLFHYAVSYCTALQTHRTPTLFKNSYLFRLFPNLSAYKLDRPIYTNNMERFMNMSYQVTEPGWSRYNTQLIEKVGQSNRTWLKGCFQSWKYLIGCEKVLRQEFTFNGTMQGQVNALMHKFASDFMKTRDIVFHDITFVAIHARLGDMMDAEIREQGYTYAPPSYINNAMDYYHSRYRWPLFIAASEDIQWCKDNINSTHNDIYFSPYTKEEYLQDFVLLSSCNHSIITVGSYGWLTGWMANGEVVYYDQFPVPDSRLSRGFSFEDKYPSYWIGMS